MLIILASPRLGHEICFGASRVEKASLNYSKRKTLGKDVIVGVEPLSPVIDGDKD